MHNITFKTLFSKASFISLAWIIIPGVVLFGLLAVFHSRYQIPVSTYTRDAVQTFEAKPYVGFVSSMGIILWAITAGILFFTAALVSRLQKNKTLARYFLYSAIFTSLFLLDDAFMFHDVIFPDYLSINEKAFFAVYGLLLIGFFIFFRDIVLNSDYILLLLTFAFFVGSAGVDQFIEYIGDLHGEYLIEDGFKFLGICTWFAYFMRISYRSTLQSVE